jgi:hypothetical protein
VRWPPDGHAGVGRPEVDADRQPAGLLARHLQETAGKAKK